MLSAIFITNNEGTILIEKQYREKISRSEISSSILAIQDHTKTPDLLTNIGDMTILHIHKNDIWLIGVCEGDEFGIFGVSVLNYVIRLLETQLAKGATEYSVKNEYYVVYRLLDYSVDFGFPLFDEGNANQTLLKQDKELRFSQGERTKLNLNKPWRSLDVKRTVNEILLDVIETMDLVVEANGKVMFSHISGKVEATSRMSGEPLCKLILRPSTHFEDVAYHRCVEVEGTNVKVIPFVPPEGKFTLMKYRLTATQTKVPIFVVPKFTWSKGNVSFVITVKFDQELQKSIDNLILKFDLPNGINTPSFVSKNGATIFDDTNREVTWKIGSINPKVQQIELTGSASTEHDFVLSGRFPVISVSFITAGTTPTVLAIEKLDVEAPYKSFRGLKYVLKSGNYEFRSGNC